MSTVKKPALGLRRPPTAAPAPEALERFIASGKVAPAVESGARVIERRDGRKLRRFNTHLPVDLFKRLRHHAVDHDQDMSAVVAAALESYLSR